MYSLHTPLSFFQDLYHDCKMQFNIIFCLQYAGSWNWYQSLVKLDCKPTISDSNTSAILAMLHKNNIDVHDMQIAFLLRIWHARIKSRPKHCYTHCRFLYISHSLHRKVGRVIEIALCLDTSISRCFIQLLILLIGAMYFEQLITSLSNPVR